MEAGLFNHYIIMADIKRGIKDEGGIFGIAATIKRKLREWKTYRETEVPPEDWDYELSIGEQKDKDKKQNYTTWVLSILVLLIIVLIIVWAVRNKK